MSLYNKYRPQTLDEIIGNRDIITTIRGLLDKGVDKFPSAILLHGPTGTGKTTLGRIIAKELGCKGYDFREVDSADFTGVDTIRDIRRQSEYKPLEGAVRVWMLDEFQRGTNQAQSALLKALEDAPPNVFYIICTTEPEKLLDTIRGRCTHLQTSILNDKDMMLLIRKVVKGENESLVRGIYENIIEYAQGHPRNALTALEQILAVHEDEREVIAKKIEDVNSQSIDLCRGLLNKDEWKKIANILKGLKGEESERIRRAVLGYMSAVLLNGENRRAAFIMDEFRESFYYNGFPGLVFKCYVVTMD